MEWRTAELKQDGSVSIPDSWLHLHYYEALNILFRMENSLRVFVYSVLKNNLYEKWTEATIQTPEESNSTIANTAAKRIAQAKGYGYLGYEINSPLMYLSSGELGRLVTSDTYWDIFKPHFRGKREIIKTKLDEIGTIRNSLAHFRPIKRDDIELIKQNIKHVFVGIERYLSEMMQTPRIVPTNTEGEWYRSITSLNPDYCSLQLHQDNSEKWIRLRVDYHSEILEDEGGREYRSLTASKGSWGNYRIGSAGEGDSLGDSQVIESSGGG